MSTQFCDRYRERNVVNPREMLALRNSKVDLSKWEPVSFGHTPPSKVKTLAAQGFVIRNHGEDDSACPPLVRPWGAEGLLTGIPQMTPKPA